jgi:hypothetical protein
LPNEFHNNQGVTVFNSIAFGGHFKLPTNSILAIDGIIMSDNPIHCNYIEAPPDSKILIDGFVEDIGLCGTLKIGDVIINSTIEGGYSGESGRLGLNNYSDIYGKIRCINYGYIYSDGFTTFHPGAGLYLEGHKNFDVNNGSSVLFKSATEIIGEKINLNESQIANPTTIIIDDSSSVIFDCELVMESNTKLVLLPGAILHLKKLSAKENSEIVMHSGSAIFFDCDTHLISKITFIRTTDEPIRFLSKSVPNCHPNDTISFFE